MLSEILVDAPLYNWFPLVIFFLPFFSCAFINALHPLTFQPPRIIHQTFMISCKNMGILDESTGQSHNLLIFARYLRENMNCIVILEI